MAGSVDEQPGGDPGTYNPHIWTPPRFDIWVPNRRLKIPRPQLLLPTLIQSPSNAVGGTPITVTLGSAQTAGNANIIAIRSDAAITAVTDSKSNLYTFVTGTHALFGNVFEAIWWCNNIVAATAGSNVVTAVSGTSSGMDIVACEYSGGLTTAFNPAADNNGNSTAVASLSFTTTTATELLFAQALSFGTIGAGTGTWTTAVSNYGFGTTIITRTTSTTVTTTATCSATSNFWQILPARFAFGGAAPKFDAIAYGAPF